MSAGIGQAEETIGDRIVEHVANSGVMYHLSLGNFDISITKHVIMLWIAAALLLALFLVPTRRYRKGDITAPRGFVNFLEAIVAWVRSTIVIPNLGAAHAATYAPLIMTFFFLIVTMNFLGLIPLFNYIDHGHGGTVATGNVNLTAALAIITFFAIIVAGVKEHGFFGYWKSVVPGNIPWPIMFILIPIEIMGMFVRPFALTMRLAANMTAGHIAMLAIFAPIFLLHNAYIGIGSVALNVGINFLEIIVSLVQAYVFALLSAVFIGMAIHPQH